MDDPFTSLISIWESFIPADFSLLPQHSDIPDNPLDGGVSQEHGPDFEAQSSDIRSGLLLAMKGTTPTGVVLQTRVTTVPRRVANTGFEMGYHVFPFVSIFDAADTFTRPAADPEILAFIKGLDIPGRTTMVSSGEELLQRLNDALVKFPQSSDQGILLDELLRQASSP